MRKKPIENPKFYGCSECSTMATCKQDKNKPCFVGFDYGLFCIYFYEKDKEDYIKAYFLEEHFKDEDEVTLRLVEKRFATEIHQYDFIEVDFVSALRGEVYEYNKEDHEWYLVEQNRGWA